MHTPSRQMPNPKHRPPAITLIHRLFAVALLGGALLALWIKPILLVGVAVLVLARSIQQFVDSRHLKRMAESRHGESICQFARSFPRREVDTWVLRAVYEELYDYLDGALPIRAGDHLHDDLRVDDEDLEIDLLGRIAERCCRSLEGTSSNPWFGRVHHVRDLVRFLDHQPSLRIIYPGR